MFFDKKKLFDTIGTTVINRRDNPCAENLFSIELVKK